MDCQKKIKISMRKINIGQKKALSDFLNNIAAAWFTIGVITPLFITTDKTLDDIITSIIFGLTGSVASLAFSFIINKDTKS